MPEAVVRSGGAGGGSWPIAPQGAQNRLRGAATGHRCRGDFAHPSELTDNEVYALTAFILAKNKLIGENDAMNAPTLPKVRMPNHDGFMTRFPDKIWIGTTGLRSGNWGAPFITSRCAREGVVLSGYDADGEVRVLLAATGVTVSPIRRAKPGNRFTCSTGSYGRRAAYRAVPVADKPGLQRVR